MYRRLLLNALYATSALMLSPALLGCSASATHFDANGGDLTSVAGSVDGGRRASGPPDVGHRRRPVDEFASTRRVIDALNRVYDVAKWRRWWKRRVLAIGLTQRPPLPRQLVELAPAFTMLWSWLRWPLMIICVIVDVDLSTHVRGSIPIRRRCSMSVGPRSRVHSSQDPHKFRTR